MLYIAVPECPVFVAPVHGAITDRAASFIHDDTQNVTCDDGYLAIRPTQFRCININAATAEWQPALDQRTCGMEHLYFVFKIDQNIW